MDDFDFEYWSSQISKWFIERLGEQLPKLQFATVPQEIVDKTPLFKYADAWANSGIVPAELPTEVYTEAFTGILLQKGIELRGEELEKIIRDTFTEAVEARSRSYSEAMEFSRQFPDSTIFILPSFYTGRKELRPPLIVHEGTHILQHAKGLGKYVMAREGLATAVQKAYRLQYGIAALSEEEKCRISEWLKESEEFRDYFHQLELGLLETVKALGLTKAEELGRADLSSLLSEKTCRAVERGVAYTVYKQSLEMELEAHQ